MSASPPAPNISPAAGKAGQPGGKLFNILKTAMLVLVTIGLGIALGSQLVLSEDSREVVVGLVTNLTFILLALASPLYGLILAIVTYPLTFHLTVVDLGRGIPNLGVDRVIFALVAGLFFLQITTGRRELRTFNIWLNVFALYFLGAYYFTFDNYHWSVFRVLQFLLDKWMFPILIYFLLSNLIYKKQNIHRVLNLLLVLGVYSAAYMVYEQLTGQVWLEWREPGQYDVYYNGSSLRITRGLYGTTSTFGNLFNLLIPIDLYYFLRTRSPARKVWYLAAFGLMLVGVFLTYKRAVWLGMLLSFLIIQFFYRRFRVLFVILLLVAAVGMAVSWEQIAASEVVETRISDNSAWETANGRTQRWEAGMNYWRQDRLFGRGFRVYERGNFKEVENFYIHLLASGGLALFIPFVMILLIIMAYSIRVYRQADTNRAIFVDKNLQPVFWGGFAAYLFMAYFGSNIEGHPISNYLFFAIAGVVVGSQAGVLLRYKKTNGQAGDG